MPFAEDQDMIPTLAPKCSDQALNICVLPGLPRGYRAVANRHCPDPPCEGLSAIIVAHQIGRCRVPRECLHDLLCQPLRRRVSAQAQRLPLAALTCRSIGSFPKIRKRPTETVLAGWGGRIRTSEWRNQNPLPYHLATPHCTVGLPPARPRAIGRRNIAARPPPINVAGP